MVTEVKLSRMYRVSVERKERRKEGGREGGDFKRKEKRKKQREDNSKLDKGLLWFGIQQIGRE